MKSRRNFIAKTSMATAALLAVNPFKAIAGLTSSFTDSANNHLVLLHASDAANALYGKTGNYISKIRSSAGNSILMNTGKSAVDNSKFDVQPLEIYQVVQKGAIKTGIIHITTGETAAINKLNETARLLKEDKNCSVVVCISHLSHKNKTGVDNLKLAAMSAHIDIIIGNDSTTSSKNLVLANKHRHEVILQYPGHNELDCGKVEFCFDENASKKHIHIGTRLYQQRIA